MSPHKVHVQQKGRTRCAVHPPLSFPALEDFTFAERKPAMVRILQKIWNRYWRKLCATQVLGLLRCTVQLRLQESSRSRRGAGEGLQARAWGPSAGSGAEQETASSGQGEKKAAKRAHCGSGLGILVLVRERGGRDSPGNKAGQSAPIRVFRTGECR